MALAKCRECRAEVSSAAKVCPRCGVKAPGVAAKPAKKPPRWGVIVGVVVAVGLITGISKWRVASSTESADAKTQTAPAQPQPKTTKASTIGQSNALKLLDAMAVECRGAMHGSPIQSVKVRGTRAELFLSRAEWLGMNSKDRAEIERLMSEAFPATKWAVQSPKSANSTGCADPVVVLASKPTPQELAAVATAASASSKALKDGEDSAIASCRHQITGALNNPDVAKFLDSSVAIVNGEYLVSQTVRGTNAFGGVITTTYQCAVLTKTFDAAILPQ